MAKSGNRSLEGICLLADLPPEVRHQLESLCTWRRFDLGDEIISYQTSSKEVFLITRGRVRVHIHTSTGREITFEDLEQGSHFGEMAALDGKTRSASVVAIEPTTLACLSRQLFIELCHQHPAVAFAAMRSMTEITRRFIRRVVALSTLGAQNRVHAELLRLARTNQAERGVLEVRPIPRHGEIAARVSTTRETVARVMAELTKQTIIQRTPTALTILDPDRLSAMINNTHK